MPYMIYHQYSKSYFTNKIYIDFFVVKNLKVTVSVGLIEVWEELNYPKGVGAGEGHAIITSFSLNFLV